MVFDLESCLRAYYSCRKGKRNSQYQLEFETEYERNLYKLSQDLINRKYEIGKSSCFVITYPTVREIFAANFTDRVVHHLLINHIGKDIDKTFIYDSLACREKKGAIFGMKRLKKFLGKVTLNRRVKAYYLKLDISSFFYSIDKNILFDILVKAINRLEFNSRDKESLIWISSKIIFHDPCSKYIKKGPMDVLKTLPADKSLFTTPKSKGLAIGNLTSQFFANLYLNELDQYIKKELKVKYYLRYADDMIFLSHNISELEKIEEKVRGFLKKKLNLEIKEKKTKYGSVYEGIDFVGYIVKPNYILSRKRTVNNIKKQLYYFNKGFLINRRLCMEQYVKLNDSITENEIEQICTSINSAFGHLKWSNSYNLRCNLYYKHFGLLFNYVNPQGNLEFFRPS